MTRRRWNLGCDLTIARWRDFNPDFIAAQDLGFAGKGAGARRVKKLKEEGVWEKLVAYFEAKDEMEKSWILSFGSDRSKEMIDLMYDYQPDESTPVENPVENGENLQ